jgi:hypothetical protein
LARHILNGDSEIFQNFGALRVFDEFQWNADRMKRHVDVVFSQQF